MLSEKIRTLDEVTETETFKKAKEILLKFTLDQLRMTPLSPQPNYTYKVTPATPQTPQRSNTTQNVFPMPPSGDLRRRIIASQNQLLNVRSSTSANTGPVPVGVAPTQNPQIFYLRNPLPRPILNRQSTCLDHVIDYLVGDGPSNRYALICRICGSHNGIAIKEEFEYFGFRCCYCNFWNPARKQKAFAPKIENTYHNLSSSNASEHISPAANVESGEDLQMEPSTPSDTDCDIEVVERPTETTEDVEHGIDEPDKNACGEPDHAEPEVKEENNGEKEVKKMDIDEDSS